MKAQKPTKGAWVITPSAPDAKNRDFDGVIGLVPHSLSLPGFKNFLIPQSSILRRVIWFCVFAVSISLCAFQISERVRFFLQYPVSTSFAVTSKTTVRFPNITICLFNPHVTPKFAAFLNMTNYTMPDVYGILKLPGMTLDDLWEMMSEDLDDLVLDCRFGKKSCKSPEYWSMENNAAGRCHLLTINEDVPYLGTESNIKLIIKDVALNKVPDANTYIMLKILLHNRYFNKIYGSFIQGMSLYSNLWARYRYWEKEFKYENTPVRPCVQPDNYTNCIQMCYEEQFHTNMEKCRLPFTVNAVHYPPCNYEQFMSIYNFSLINTFIRMDTSKCNCGRPCHDLNYDIKPDLRSGKGNGNSTVIIQPGRPDVESMYEMRAYTVTSLVSDIGGALGLYLGACILTFFEILNLVFQAVVQRIHRVVSVNSVARY